MPGPKCQSQPVAHGRFRAGLALTGGEVEFKQTFDTLTLRVRAENPG
jgi:hypothetical protein